MAGRAESMRSVRAALRDTDLVGVYYDGSDPWVTDRYVLFRASRIAAHPMAALGAAESGWYRAAASGMQPLPDRHGWDTGAIAALARRIEDPSVTWLPLTLTRWAVTRPRYSPALLLTGPELRWVDSELLARWQATYAPRELIVECAAGQPRMPLRLSVSDAVTWARPRSGITVPRFVGYIMPVTVPDVPALPELRQPVEV